MLKLFFVIITLARLAKSQIAVEWICDEAQSMGNCSSIPKITDLLQIISENSDNDEYTDFHYCPFHIVERHTKCMRKYYNSCYMYMSDFVQNIFYVYIPADESSETLCDKNRPYKKEFREHTTCTKALLKADDDFEEYLVDSEMQYGLLLDDINSCDKCKIMSRYWRDLTTRIRKECGSKTEKFSRQVLSNIWPLSMLSKLCSDLLSLGQ